MVRIIVAQKQINNLSTAAQIALVEKQLAVWRCGVYSTATSTLALIA